MNQNAIKNAYVGNEVLPNGTNPFAPQPTPSDDKKTATWVIILSVLAGLLLIGLGVIIYKWRNATKSATGDRVQEVEPARVPLANNFSDGL